MGAGDEVSGIWPGQRVSHHLPAGHRCYFDVFGDGSVVILSTPGHTPGHQSLFLDLPITGPVIVSGDLYHTVLNRKHRASPSFNTDAAETRKSMQRIERLLEERSAQLWIQHDASTGPAAPALVE